MRKVTTLDVAVELVASHRWMPSSSGRHVEISSISTALSAGLSTELPAGCRARGDVLRQELCLPRETSSMELSEDDVLEILKLFEQSKFDFLQLQHGERKITVSKGGTVPQGAGVTATVAAPAISASAGPTVSPPAPTPAP